jgi:hypothetical protein
MTLWMLTAVLIAASLIVWRVQRWHTRQSQYLPQNWTRRQAEKAWRK